MSDTDSFSRFKESELITTSDGRNTFGLMSKFKFLDRSTLPDDEIIKITITSTRAGRPDLIANDLYSTSIHFWILLIFNNVVNPFGWPKIGTMIEAPKRSFVITEF